MAVSLRLASLRARLEKELTSNLLYIQGATDYIALKPDLNEEDFQRYGREVMRHSTLLKNLVAAPDFIMSLVYPLEGNEAVRGVDYRSLPAQWEQARLAEETGEMVIAGPLPLVQGGVGLIGRAPVFTPEGESSRFWGLVSAVIDVDTLLDEMAGNLFSDLRLAIRGKDGKGERGDVFYGDASLFAPDSDAVIMSVEFPSGSWQLAAVPEGGWRVTSPFLPFMHALLALLTLTAILGARNTWRKSREVERVKEGLSEAQAIAHLGSWRQELEHDSLWWSEETYRIFGVWEGEFTPSVTASMEFVHPEDRAATKAAYEKGRKEGGSFAVDYRIVRPDGSIRYVAEQGVGERDANGGIARFKGTVLDITDRKLVENALRESQERFDHIVEKLDDKVIFFSRTLDGELLYVSEGYSRLGFGPSRNAVGKKWSDAVRWTAESLEAIKQNSERMLADKSYASGYDAYYYTPEGTLHSIAIYSYCIFNASRNDYIVEGIAIDKTEEMVRERELRVLTRAVENAPVSIVILGVDARVTYVNPYCAQISGFTREEAMIRNEEAFNACSLDNRSCREMWERLKVGETWRGEMPNHRKDGELFWESVSISPILDEKGAVVSYVAVKDDISSKKELDRLKEDVNRIMRHDLKTPLGGIVTLPQVLELEGNLTESQIEITRAIQDAGRKMLNMIDLSLDIFKMETGTFRFAPQAVDILDVTAKVVEECGTMLRSKQARVLIRVDGAPPEKDLAIVGQSDERLLSSMLSNLLINAIEASSPGGEINIELTRSETLFLSIRNSGAVPHSIREHFFEKYATHGKVSGTGLGTYSAKLMAKAMGYDIRMETSDEGDWTRVEIMLPFRPVTKE